MRIFVADTSGVTGVSLEPLLVQPGHAVAGMTRSPERLAAMQALGPEPVLCDVTTHAGGATLWHGLRRTW